LRLARKDVMHRETKFDGTKLPLVVWTALGHNQW
jgi:hypothetical protein